MTGQDNLSFYPRLGLDLYRWDPAAVFREFSAASDAAAMSLIWANLLKYALKSTSRYGDYQNVATVSIRVCQNRFVYAQIISEWGILFKIFHGLIFKWCNDSYLPNICMMTQWWFSRMRGVSENQISSLIMDANSNLPADEILWTFLRFKSAQIFECRVEKSTYLPFKSAKTHL